EDPSYPRFTVSTNCKWSRAIMSDRIIGLRGRLFLALALVLPACWVAQGRDGEPAQTKDDDKLVQYALEGMKASRNKLRSGACEVSGKDATGDFKMTYHFEG